MAAAERDLDPLVAAELAKPSFFDCLFTEAIFPGGPIRIWTGLGDYPWDGKTWTGAGEALSVSAPSESLDSASSGVRVTLDLSIERLKAIGGSDFFFDLGDYQGGSAAIWWALLDEAGNVIGAPMLVFEGRLDSDEITDDGQTLGLTINIEDEKTDQLKARSIRYTPEDQKLLYPTITDRGFDQVASLQDIDIST